MKDVAELISLCDLLKRRSRIGNGNELIASFAFANYLLHAFEKVLLENVWLESAA